MTYQYLTSEPLLIGVSAFIILLLAVVFFAVRYKSTNAYERQQSILTPSEQHFYKVLSSATNGRAIIMAKVRIADLLSVSGAIIQKHFWSYFSKISQKHIDFVLFDPQTFTTLCVIELDDKSHANYDRTKRDKFINDVMGQTGIPLYRFPVRRRYDHGKIKEKLNIHL